MSKLPSAGRIFKAIVTDVQFWVPVAVLGFGLALLIALH
ncbi:MAG TPA: translocated intimin receptor Tir [Terriglobus sp.]